MLRCFSLNWHDYLHRSPYSSGRTNERTGRPYTYSWDCTWLCSLRSRHLPRYRLLSILADIDRDRSGAAVSAAAAAAAALQKVKWQEYLAEISASCRQHACSEGVQCAVHARLQPTAQTFPLPFVELLMWQMQQQLHIPGTQPPLLLCMSAFTLLPPSILATVASCQLDSSSVKLPTFIPVASARKTPKFTTILYKL